MRYLYLSIYLPTYLPIYIHSPPTCLPQAASLPGPAPALRGGRHDSKSGMLRLVLCAPRLLLMPHLLLQVSLILLHQHHSPPLPP